jgi:predicted DNA-binding transcriptional regulator YafY
MAIGGEQPKKRSDRDRRVRQCERFARLIRITRLLLGHGRWRPEDLARDIGCSVRTVYRDITTLTMAGIPIRFDKDANCYRVTEGFRFPGFSPDPSPNREILRQLAECQKLLDQIRKTLHSGPV